MHTLSRPIYVTQTPTGAFLVTCYRGWMNEPKKYTFTEKAEAISFAAKKLMTKYYSKSCVIDETKETSHA